MGVNGLSVGCTQDCHCVSQGGIALQPQSLAKTRIMKAHNKEEFLRLCDVFMIPLWATGYVFEASPWTVGLRL